MMNFYILVMDNKYMYIKGIDCYFVGMVWCYWGNVFEFVGCLFLMVLVDSLLCLIFKIDCFYYSYIYIVYLFIVVFNIGDIVNINS